MHTPAASLAVAALWVGGFQFSNSPWTTSSVVGAERFSFLDAPVTLCPGSAAAPARDMHAWWRD